MRSSKLYHLQALNVKLSICETHTCMPESAPCQSPTWEPQKAVEPQIWTPRYQMEGYPSRPVLFEAPPVPLEAYSRALIIIRIGFGRGSGISPSGIVIRTIPGPTYLSVDSYIHLSTNQSICIHARVHVYIMCIYIYIHIHHTTYK